jgi:hypothetical protein
MNRLLRGLALGLLLSPAVLLEFSAPAAASPACVAGTLASYESLGSGGCTLGDETVSSFAIGSGATGATRIDPTTLTVTPTANAGDATLTFRTSLTAQANNQDEAFFTYTIAGAPVTLDAINLSGSSETADGAVTYIQNFCVGSGGLACTGISGGLLALDGIQNSDQSGIPNATLLSITSDFELDGGLSGSASGGQFSDHFMDVAPVPLPPSVVCLCTGLAALAFVHRFARRRRLNHV